MLFVFYLLKSVAECWAEPPSFTVNVLKIRSRRETKPRSRRRRLTHSDYVFSQCAASVSRLNLIRAPCFLGGITLSYLARIFGFWPFSVGHPDRRFERESDPSCFSPLPPYCFSHQDEGLALPHQPAIPGKVVSTKWDVADNIGD